MRWPSGGSWSSFWGYEGVGAGPVAGNLQLARLGIHIPHFLVLERRIELAIAETRGVTLVHRLQQQDLRMIAAGFRHIEEVHRLLPCIVHHHPGGIAQVRRPQHRQHDVRAFRHAIEAQGLAEVLVLARQAHLGRRVPKPANADDGVEHQAGGDFRRALGLELQHTVEQVGHIPQVVEEVAHSGAHEAWGDVLVATHQRQQHPLVQAVVEVVDAPVHRFQRVVHVQRGQGRALEFALVQPGVEFQFAQRVDEAIGLRFQGLRRHLRVGFDHAGTWRGFRGQGIAGNQQGGGEEAFVNHGRTPAWRRC